MTEKEWITPQFTGTPLAARPVQLVVQCLPH